MSEENAKRNAGPAILQVSEDVLSRLVLDIHDGPVQNLYAALSKLEALRQRCGVGGAGAEIGRELDQVTALIECSLGEIREFIGTFRPPEFQRRDLLGVLRGLLIEHESRTDAHVELEVEGSLPDASVPLKIAFYRVLQEALSNARRHAAATRLGVRLRPEARGIMMVVSDDGAGFDVDRALGEPDGHRATHLGLRGMRHRMEIVGGTFRIESEPGRGTRLAAWAPAGESHDGDT